MKNIYKLLTICVLVFTVFNLSAQPALPPTALEVDIASLVASWDVPKSVLLLEDFEGAFPSAWSRTSLGQGWDTASQAVMGMIPLPPHTRYMITNDGESGPGNNGCCDELITPALDLTAFPGYQLKFQSFFTGNYGQLASVKMSADHGLNWTTLLQMAPNPAWQEISIDLSMYSGPGGLPDVQFSFYADDQGLEASGWAVDDIVVSSVSLGVTGYEVSVDASVIGNTSSTSYQIDPSLYAPGSAHTFCVSAVYGFGTSPELCRNFSSMYMPPPLNLSAVTVGDSIVFTWDIPVTQAPLMYFLLYRADSTSVSIPSTVTSYSIYCLNGEVCIRMTSVYELGVYGFPGLYGESFFASACGYSDSGFDLQFTEDWSTGQFALNRWEAGPGWEIDTQSGNDLPSVKYSSPSGKAAFSSALKSWYLDATAITECTPAEVHLDFDIMLEDPHSPATDTLNLQIITEEEVYTVASYVFTCSSGWAGESKNITNLVRGKNFQVCFLFSGSQPGDSSVWHLDNIHSYSTINCFPQPLIISAKRTGTPENDILVSWPEEPPYNIVSYVLDDNTAEADAGLDQTGECWFGNSFPVTESGILKEVSLFFSEDQSVPGSLSVDFFDAGHTLLGSSAVFTPTAGTWNTIWLPEISYNQQFYAMLHLQSEGPSARIAIDTTGPNAPMALAWQVDGSGWSPFPQTGVFLLRVKAQLDGDNRVTLLTPSTGLECDTLGYSVYRKAYASFPPGGNSGTADFEWIGCTPKGISQFLDKDLDNQSTNCYEYAVSIIYRTGESLPEGSAWDCIYVGQPENPEEQELMLYPNPADEQVRIHSKQSIAKVQVTNLEGKQMNFIVSGEKNDIILDTSSYSPGIMLVTVTDRYGKSNHMKLIIKH